MRARAVAILLVNLLVIATACGSDDDVASDGTQVFTDVDSTSQVSLTSGETFELHLESNRTTGYAWEISAMSEARLAELVSQEYEEPESDLVGAPGTEVWEFTTGAEGAGVLRLEYVRPSDDPPIPERVFELIVRIDGAPWPPPGATVAPDDTSSAVAPDGITSVADLLADSTPRDVVARGVVVWSLDGARLCEVLAESFPPQCGGQSVTIADPEALVVDLESEADVRWTDLPVDLDAHFDGGQLIVGGR